MSIEVRHLSFSYGSRQVLKDVTFSVDRGRLLSVLGPNGVGKSTLFRCILGLLRGYQGEITVDGASVSSLGARELARKVAYIPQPTCPASQYSVFDMVLMGTTAQIRGFSSPGPKQEAAAREALERLDIGHLAQRSYTRLSGGERQLVLIARALAQQSTVLLMDEPTANLDYGNQIRVLTKVRALADAGYTVIQSTHNPEQSYLFSHQILAMKDGQVLSHGTPDQVMNGDLIKALYGIDAEVVPLRDGRMRVCIPRDLPTFSPCTQVEDTAGSTK